MADQLPTRLPLRYLSKADAIRIARDAHPHATSSEVAALLRGYGVHVTDTYVRQVKARDTPTVPAPEPQAPAPHWAEVGEFYRCTPKCGYVWRFLGRDGWERVSPERRKPIPHEDFKEFEADCWGYIRRTYRPHHPKECPDE